AGTLRCSRLPLRVEVEVTQPPVHTVDSERFQGRAHQFAALLDALEVAPRATVAILARNTPEFIWAYRGATWSGRMVVPLSWRWTSADIGYVLEDSKAAVLVADARHADLVSNIEQIPARSRFVFNGSAPGFQDLASALAQQPVEASTRAMAGDVMPYTSGTTGRPKGVVRPLPEGPPPTFSAEKGAAMLERTPGATAGPHLVCTPMYHAAPLFYADGALLLGCDLVMMERFDAEEVLAVIEKHRVASVFMVPTQFVRMLGLDESIRS